ncbi:MAG: polyribonucleotide nucleotidyltransferase [Desulfovibrionales bacterium]
MLEGKSVTATIGSDEIIIETGKFANQAHGSVTVQCGDTVVLVTAVTQPLMRDIDFMPLVVDYTEKSYAYGKIPGNFFRREMGRPSERETLTSRLIDRPIRPLFPDGFNDEVQILATVLSAEADKDPGVLAMIGASAALHISKIPFNGPIAGIRVGRVNEEFMANPSQAELEQSSLNLIIAGSKDAVVMVEGGAEFVHEDVIAQAIAWGHEQLQPLLALQDELQQKVGVEKLSFTPPVKDTELEDFIREKASAGLAQALSVPEKMARKAAKAAVKDELWAALNEKYAETPEKIAKASAIFKDLEKGIVRDRIRRKGERIDGRDLTTVRQLAMEITTLPRAHGSALFARGETKALGVTTLGSSSDEQRIEVIGGEAFNRFMFHYNFPPYSVGEVKMVRVSRRELGHGALAARALTPVLPAPDEFPFTIRVVSEIMESNGSSSMASVCVGSLSMMDAGVPIKAPVAGIAMGLIKEEDEYFILTDILGDEDHLGDMDFKVAGTMDGVTAIQMDIKISGIPTDVLERALSQARDARQHILGQMDAVIAKPREELSKYAPQMEVVYVDPEKIRDVIGPGGKNIKAMTAATGASIDIEDSGRISIFAPTQEALRDAVEMVLFYDQKPELGKDYNGKVKKLMDFGAFVEILPGVEGLVHISQLDTDRVEKVDDVVNLGDEIRVKVIEIESSGRLRLSRKAVLIEEQGGTFNLEEASRPSGPPRGGGGRGGGRPPRGGGDRRR